MTTRKRERRLFRDLLNRAPHVVVPLRDTELDAELWPPHDRLPEPTRPIYAIGRSPAPRIPRARPPVPSESWTTHSESALQAVKVVGLTFLAGAVLLAVYCALVVF
jgi:hypothetical protein